MKSNADIKRHGGNPKPCWTIDNGVVLVSVSISAMAEKLVINGMKQDPHNILDSKANKKSLMQKRKQDGFIGDGGSFKYKRWEIFMGPPPEGYYDGMILQIEKEDKEEDPDIYRPLLGHGYILEKWDSSMMSWER